MSPYWAGVLTLPAIALVLAALAFLLNRTMRFLHRRGWTIEWTDGKNYDLEDADEFGYHDYDKRHAILWSASWGPIFWGHWCRQEGSATLATRWVGIGAKVGASLTVHHKRKI